MKARTNGSFSERAAWRFSLRLLLVAAYVLPLLATAWAGVFGDFVRFLALQFTFLFVFGILLFFMVHLPSSPNYRRSPESSGPATVEYDTVVANKIAMLEQLVDVSRRAELTAEARYDAAAGPVEDVIHARAMRLKAEIDLIRYKCRNG